MNYKITQDDSDEMAIAADILKKIDTLENSDLETIWEEMYNQQPFFLSLLLGYEFDVTKAEHEELIKIYLLIWKYFKALKRIPQKKITQKFYEKNQRKTLNMLKYSEGEPNQQAQREIYFNDFMNIKSKSLWACIFYIFQKQAVLSKMTEKKKGDIMIGLKSLIVALETI